MISQTTNMELVNSILRIPEIWSEVAPEGMEYFDTPYLSQCTYFLVNDTDGVIIFDLFRDSVKIHPNIVPAKRGKVAYIAVEESIRSMFDAGYASVYAEIDPKLRHVVRFAKQLGFRLLESGDRNMYIRRRLNS